MAEAKKDPLVGLVDAQQLPSMYGRTSGGRRDMLMRSGGRLRGATSAKVKSFVDGCVLTVDEDLFEILTENSLKMITEVAT